MLKKILITGADGFIGSHLVEYLVRLGYEVKAFVLYNSLSSWGWLDRCSQDVKGKFTVSMGDIRDYQSVRDAMRGCDAVLHLAALVGIPYSYRSPASYLEVNVKGTLNVLEAAREVGVDRVIHTSTSEVYGTAQYVPIDELHPLCGQSPYSATKIGADQLAYAYYSSFGLPVVIARPFNTYGPRQSSRAIIPSIITQIAGVGRSIKLGSTTPTRDFCYVSDTVKGFALLLEGNISDGEVVNFGTGEEISIGEIATSIAELMGREIEVIFDEERSRPVQSEVERLCADNTKACMTLGWSPSYSGKDGLRRGLAETISWFTQAENLSAYRADTYGV